MATILILDDDRDILRMLDFALTRAGHQIITTTSGNEGLAIIRKQPIDLIIADVMMPEMTGYEFTRQVRRLPHQDKIPILIYSARFQTVDRQTALEAGATAYLPKSIAPPELVEKISQILGQDARKEATRTGRTIAFFSLNGGSGVTTLAVNVAVVLALSRKTTPGLLDLNPIAGHTNLLLGLRPKTHLYQLLTANETSILPHTLEKYLTPHNSGVRLLASPILPPEANIRHSLKQVVKVANSRFSITLLDLPHYLTADNGSLLAQIDKLVLVVSPTVPGLQSAVVGLSYLTQRGLTGDKIVPVLNHATPQVDLRTDRVEQAIRHSLTAEIPFEGTMAAAVTAGRPLVLQTPKSPTAMAIARLTMQLTT